MRKNHNFIRLGRHGRLMKEDEPGGGGDTGITTPGGQGNSGQGASGGSDSNNTSDAFDPAAFWGGSEQDGRSDPSGESAQGGNNDSGTGSSNGNDLREVLMGRLESMTFGDPVFTAEITEQINNGDFSGVQAAMDKQLRQAVQQSLGLTTSILRPFAEQLMSQMREEMQTTFSTRDDNESLESLFPAAKNPAVRPTIQNIYSQALKNTKGNRESAVKQTKEMLRFMAGTTAGDLDINVAPRGADDFGSPPRAPTNWLDELTGRK